MYVLCLEEVELHYLMNRDDADETGSADAKRGIFLCYDVFGLYIQALKGADILASDYAQFPDGAGDFKVFMPDFWGDNPQDLSLFPPKTPAQTKIIMDFFITGPANIGKTQPWIMPLLEAMKAQHPEIEVWAIMGFCWGGKIAALFSSKGSPFKASAQCHPSLLDVNDAKSVKIPMVVLPSMDEDSAVWYHFRSSKVVLICRLVSRKRLTCNAYYQITKEWENNLLAASPSSYLETFKDQPHGWMTSRYALTC